MPLALACCQAGPVAALLRTVRASCPCSDAQYADQVDLQASLTGHLITTAKPVKWSSGDGAELTECGTGTEGGGGGDDGDGEGGAGPGSEVEGEDPQEVGKCCCTQCLHGLAGSARAAATHPHASSAAARALAGDRAAQQAGAQAGPEAGTALAAGGLVRAPHGALRPCGGRERVPSEGPVLPTGRVPDPGAPPAMTACCAAPSSAVTVSESLSVSWPGSAAQRNQPNSQSIATCELSCPHLPRLRCAGGPAALCNGAAHLLHAVPRARL